MAFRWWGVKIRSQSWENKWPFGWSDPRRKWDSVLIEADCQVKLSFNFSGSQFPPLKKKTVEIPFFFFKEGFIYLFSGCGGSLLLHAGFLLQQEVSTLCCNTQASHCRGFSCYRAWVLGTWASVAVAHGLSSCSSWTLEHWLNSCGSRA